MAEIPTPKSLSQMQIEIGWPRTLFVFVLLLSIMITAANLMLVSYKRVLDGRNADIKQEIDDLSKSIPSADITRLITLDRQIKNLRVLLSKHTYVSRIYDQIESLTQPQVRWTIINVNAEKHMVVLRGLAPTMGAVALQTAAFSQSKQFESVTINNANTAVGGISFDTELKFAPSLILPAAR